MDELRPLLVRMRIAALQSEVRSKTGGDRLVVRSQRNKVAHVPDASGSHSLDVVFTRRYKLITYTASSAPLELGVGDAEACELGLDDELDGLADDELCGAKLEGVWMEDDGADELDAGMLEACDGGVEELAGAELDIGVLEAGMLEAGMLEAGVLEVDELDICELEACELDIGAPELEPSVDELEGELVACALPLLAEVLRAVELMEG